VCQLHTALAALVKSLWLESPKAEARLLEKAARKINKQQQRNAAARRSHTKKTRKRLQTLGIKLTQLPRCGWG
jgi:hypothetical protein